MEREKLMVAGRSSGEGGKAGEGPRGWKELWHSEGTSILTMGLQVLKWEQKLVRRGWKGGMTGNVLSV